MGNVGMSGYGCGWCCINALVVKSMAAFEYSCLSLSWLTS